MTRNGVIRRLNPVLYPIYRVAKRRFGFAGHELRYFASLYNSAHLNERTVEVPIALHYVRQARTILEVGNVINHYAPFPHDVIDKFEKATGVKNCDARAFRTERRYDLIVSISTLEHIGWDEKPQEPEAFLDALKNLLSLLVDHGKLVCTLPLGYNAWLDHKLRLGQIPFSSMRCLRRVNVANSWKECRLDDIADAPWNDPYFGASAIVVGLIHPVGNGDVG